ncbi:hypothetical protein [Streptomyces sp. NPDC048462]|uniref:hypothetical protein n=1 Tax=Streptomyces sp. NPDC048462 TaxID=3365555 RepID=UPI00371DB2A0
MSGGEPPGVDLARVALRAAMEAARKNGTDPKAKKQPRPVRTVRRDGRDHRAVLRDGALGPGRQDLRRQDRLVLILGQLDGNDALVSHHPFHFPLLQPAA